MQKLFIWLSHHFSQREKPCRFPFAEERNILLENLLSSFGHLAPEEFKVTFDQRYFQSLVESRGWVWRLSGDPTLKEYKYCAEIFDEHWGLIYSGETIGSKAYAKDPAIALLHSYVKILAIQRTIAPGQWQHFQGRIIEVDENLRYCFDGQDFIADSKTFLALVDSDESMHEGLLIFRKLERERMDKTGNIFDSMQGLEDLNPDSAEGKALQRIDAIDAGKKVEWRTTIRRGDLIDEDDLDRWLTKRGYSL